MTNEMTAKEAVRELKILREEYWDDDGYGHETQQYDDTITALDLAIKALEQQPCIEDYPTCTECEHYDKEKHYCPRFCQVIKDTLAEAQPSEDCISRQDAIDFIIDNYGVGFNSLTNGIRDYLPSVTPQRPKGKWKRIAGFKDCNYNKCSVCGVYQLFYYGKPSTNYCPNCGAEMSGGEEDGKDSAFD